MIGIHPEVAHLVRTLPEPTLLLESTGIILLANEAAARLVGMQGSSLTGVPLESLINGPIEKTREFLRICARSRQLIPGAFAWRSSTDPAIDVRCDGMALSARTDGSPAVLFLRCRPKAESTDQFALLNQKIAALTKEILDRKKAEVQRDELLLSERASRKEAEKAIQIRDEFLANLSHELRTPLSAMMGWTQVLLHPKSKGEDFIRGITTIQRNVRIQADLVEDLLDMSRIITGKIRLQVQPVELAATIENALESLRPAADAKDIRLRTMLDTTVGPVKGDPERLQQVIWNLVSNAVKFTPKGGQIKISLERVDSHVEFTVSDTGEGVDADFLPHVFDRFRQADSSTTRRHGGLGLGLAIVKQLVELHGGSVRAKSAGKGKGATFLVALPLMALDFKPSRRASDLPAAAASGAGKERLEARSLQGITVVVVDDNDDTREMLQQVLSLSQAVVMTAGSGREALDLIEAEPPDILLCDIGMPEMDGYQLIRILRSREPDRGGLVPAVAVTAFARVEDRRRSLLAGFNAHLAKPVDSLELLATIASLTRLAGGQKAGASASIG